MYSPKHIIITGASSGLGAALAEQYAAPGVTLGLTGRNAARLEKVAEKCRDKGARAVKAVIDVRDDAIMAEWITEFEAKYPVDLIIANAGISAGSGGNPDEQKTLRDIFAINVNGVINTIMPAIAYMRERKAGQVAIISSLTAIRGMPSCPAYSASKAAVRFLGEGLRGELKDWGIEVSVVCPGYIDTPMTQVNEFYMPFMLSATQAARKIQKGLEKNTSRIAFPWMLYLPLYLLSCLPVAMTDTLFAKLPKKK